MGTAITENMPSIRGTNITADEIRQNLALCKKTAIATNKLCSTVHQNSKSFWRSTKLTGFSHKQDLININLANQCCAFNHPELVAFSPSDVMSPWEKDYLSQGPLINMADTAWASKSSVELVGGAKEYYYVGDDVSLIIRIRTGRGKDRGRGGDGVRLWVVNSTLGAAVTANVKDKGDGTYEARVKLPWAGKAIVRATIAHTRELYRSTLYIQRLFTTTHWFAGVYQNKHASEASPCSPLPFFPAFSGTDHICNLTKENGGVPWYCGKPVKKNLSCTDMKGSIKNTWPSIFPLTIADRELIKITESKRPFLIPTKISFEVKPKQKSNLTTLPIPSLNCSQRDLKETFREGMSTGYFFKSKWRPFSCALPNVTRTFTNNCMTNTTIILIGDSNSRAQMDLLMTLTGCKDKIIRTKVKWHAPLRCEIDSLALSVQLYPHKLPFYGSRAELMTHKMLTSTVEKLNSIPSTGRYVILLHNFLHMIPFHISIFRTRLQHNRKAVSRVLKRNPNTYFIIQSPHAAYDHSKFNKHKMNIHLYHMTKSMMTGLGDRVMFLNTFDLTIAKENNDGHPKFAKEFTDLYLGYLCGR